MDDELCWENTLQNVPKFPLLTVAEHLKGCGKKKVGDKGYNCFYEELCTRRLKGLVIFIREGRGTAKFRGGSHFFYCSEGGSHFYYCSEGGITSFLQL